MTANQTGRYPAPGDFDFRQFRHTPITESAAGNRIDAPPLQRQAGREHPVSTPSFYKKPVMHHLRLRYQLIKIPLIRNSSGKMTRKTVPIRVSEIGRAHV